MLEIPEAYTIAQQINASLPGKTIKSVQAASSPHKFAWYHSDPQEYAERLAGNAVLAANPAGGMVEVKLTNASLLFSDGVNLRYHTAGQSIPEKHQLLLHFTDGSALTASVQMYGGLLCWNDSEVLDNPYYQVAKVKPSPLSDSFDEAYFLQILASEDVLPLSLKAALATQQRIPGLGNGVLQDILWKARLAHRRKVNALSQDERRSLFASLKQTLAEMTQLGGRDTEKDLFGNPGSYAVVMSAKNKGNPCPVCRTPIVKEAYLGGSVYYCGHCQKS